MCQEAREGPIRGQGEGLSEIMGGSVRGQGRVRQIPCMDWLYKRNSLHTRKNYQRGKDRDKGKGRSEASTRT